MNQTLPSAPLTHPMTIKDLKEIIASIDPELDGKEVWYVDFGGYERQLLIFDDAKLPYGIAISGT